MRYFAKLQMDDVPSIRVNTTICLGKLASCLRHETRKKVLGSAFLRSLKDPFSHARNAGLLALGATQQYFSASEIAHKLFPGVVAVTLDADVAVKTQALKLSRTLLDRLDKGPADEDTTVTSSSAAASVGTAGGGAGAAWAWASTAVVSGISSAFKKSTVAADGGGGGATPASTASAQQRSTGNSDVDDGTDDDDDAFADASSKSNRFAVATLEANDDDGGADGGWGDDNDDDGNSSGDWGGGGDDSDNDSHWDSPSSQSKTSSFSRAGAAPRSAGRGMKLGKAAPAGDSQDTAVDALLSGLGATSGTPRSKPSGLKASGSASRSDDDRAAARAARKAEMAARREERKKSGGLGGVKKKSGLGGVKKAD
eukprot:m.753744 g.753744  ORF g.753744 m.753744 type:complete len:369 (+) comp23173_c0_seq13:2170-3276(+)